ncbi:MAG: thiamine phosphate synthase [Sphingobacteriaceae bacterium]|nr:thiamine phosphate synthase [Sphingobacteriaceae bacterium]
MLPALIIFSHENDIDDETKLVNELFNHGMEFFHLRKPGWSSSDQIKYLSQINPEYLNKISIHQHYASAQEFNLSYIHVKEKARADFEARQFSNYKLSTSFHQAELIEKESKQWHHCFLSPVFNSISKKDYTSEFGNNFKINNPNKNIYALGGITQHHVADAIAMGFSGVAALGAIWSLPGSIIENFTALNEICKLHVPL